MSERVQVSLLSQTTFIGLLILFQLLLSDRVLGMTLVPEGKVWNYGIGLTQMWSPSLGYSMTLDTPLLFWAEQHRPAAFLTVSPSSLS